MEFVLTAGASVINSLLSQAIPDQRAAYGAEEGDADANVTPTDALRAALGALKGNFTDANRRAVLEIVNSATPDALDMERRFEDGSTLLHSAIQAYKPANAEQVDALRLLVSRLETVLPMRVEINGQKFFMNPAEYALRIENYSDAVFDCLISNLVSRGKFFLVARETLLYKFVNASTNATLFAKLAAAQKAQFKTSASQLSNIVARAAEVYDAASFNNIGIIKQLLRMGARTDVGVYRIRFASRVDFESFRVLNITGDAVGKIESSTKHMIVSAPTLTIKTLKAPVFAGDALQFDIQDASFEESVGTVTSVVRQSALTTATLKGAVEVVKAMLEHETTPFISIHDVLKVPRPYYAGNNEGLKLFMHAFDYAPAFEEDCTLFTSQKNIVNANFETDDFYKQFPHEIPDQAWSMRPISASCLSMCLTHIHPHTDDQRYTRNIWWKNYKCCALKVAAGTRAMCISLSPKIKRSQSTYAEVIFPPGTQYKVLDETHAVTVPEDVIKFSNGDQVINVPVVEVSSLPGRSSQQIEILDRNYYYSRKDLTVQQQQVVNEEFEFDVSRQAVLFVANKFAAMTPRKTFEQRMAATTETSNLIYDYTNEFNDKMFKLRESKLAVSKTDAVGERDYLWRDYVRSHDAFKYATMQLEIDAPFTLDKTASTSNKIVSLASTGTGATGVVAADQLGSKIITVRQVTAEFKARYTIDAEFAALPASALGDEHKAKRQRQTQPSEQRMITRAIHEEPSEFTKFWLDAINDPNGFDTTTAPGPCEALLEASRAALSRLLQGTQQEHDSAYAVLAYPLGLSAEYKNAFSSNADLLRRSALPADAQRQKLWVRLKRNHELVMFEVPTLLPDV